MKSTHQVQANIKSLGYPALILVFLLWINHSNGQVSSEGYDTPPIIDFEMTEMTVAENATNVEIYLFRTGEFRTITRVDYQTVEDSASEGDDYRASGGTVVFAPGEGFKVLSIPIVADEVIESTETFRVELSCSNPDVILVHNSTTVNIQDTSAPPLSNPRLNIQQVDNNTILLSWPKTSPSYVLESAPACAKGNWSALSEAPEAKDSTYELRQPLTNSFAYFRLRSP